MGQAVCNAFYAHCIHKHFFWGLLTRKSTKIKKCSNCFAHFFISNILKIRKNHLLEYGSLFQKELELLSIETHKKTMKS